MFNFASHKITLLIKIFSQTMHISRFFSKFEQPINPILIKAPVINTFSIFKKRPINIDN